MRGILTALTLALLLTVSLSPAGTAGESRSYVYDLAYGATTEAAGGSGIVYDVCFDINTVGELAGYPQLDDDVCGLNGGHLNIGGVQAVETPPAYSGVVVQATDEIGNPYISGAYSETGPAEGGFVNEPFGSGCGPIISTERETDYLNVFVYVAYVADDLGMCLGSTGTINMDYF